MSINLGDIEPGGYRCIYIRGPYLAPPTLWQKIKRKLRLKQYIITWKYENNI